MDVIFSHAVTSQNVFRILTTLKTATQPEIDEMLKVLITSMRANTREGQSKRPELLASYGVYLSLILRYKPAMNLYVEDEHFLSVAASCFYPYFSLYISVFLIPAHLCGVDVDDPVHIDNTSTNPIRTVLNKLKTMCNPTSPDNHVLSELKKLHRWGIRNFLDRVGFKSHRQELAIFLDSADLLEGPFDENDIQKSLFMHSNTVLMANSESLMPHHFERALVCLNYDIAKLLDSRSDWIRPDLLEELFYSSRKLGHAICLELIFIAVRKNIVLCEHLLKKLPVGWRQQILDVYKVPRWQSCNYEEEDHATLEFYRLHLSYPNGPSTKILESITSMIEKLDSDEAIDNFVAKIKNMNKSFYLFEWSGYTDLLHDDKITFGNDTDMIGNDIFEISKNFVFVTRESNRIYLFDYATARTLIEKGQNPYNRKEISATVRDEIASRFAHYNTIGIGTDTVPMGDFIREMKHGRPIEFPQCYGHPKNYRKKLIRSLKNYGIRDEHLDIIIIDDIVFKLQLVAVDLQAKDIQELCENLHRAIKTAPEDKQETLKVTIVDIIRIYSNRMPVAVVLDF